MRKSIDLEKVKEFIADHSGNCKHSYTTNMITNMFCEDYYKATGFRLHPGKIERRFTKCGFYGEAPEPICFEWGRTPEDEIEAGSENQWATAVKLRDAAHHHILANCGEADFSYRSSNA